MFEHRIYLIGGADDEFGVVRGTDANQVCQLSFSYGHHSVEAEANDYFDALCNIRLKLEKERLIPFCYGASLNVYPSGMGRDMGRGLKAYKLAVGKHTRREDLVDIFSAGTDVVPAFVSLQKEFFDEWSRSIKM